MHALEVGQLYYPGRTVWPEFIDYNFRAGGHELRLFLPGLTPREIADLRAGTVQLGLVVDGPVLLLLFCFGTAIPWSDAPYTIHRVSPEERQPPMPLATPETRDTLQIVVVEATSGIVQVLRLVTFSPEFTRALRTAIAAQLATPWVWPDAYERHLAGIYRRTDSAALLRRATARCTGGD